MGGCLPFLLASSRLPMPLVALSSAVDNAIRHDLALSIICLLSLGCRHHTEWSPNRFVLIVTISKYFRTG